MSIGIKIIEAIADGSMFVTHDGDGPIERPLIYVWSSGAAEQLEAVVHQYIEEEIRARLSHEHNH